MSYQKNDVLTVKIEDMGHDGEGIGKCEAIPSLSRTPSSAILRGKSDQSKEKLRLRAPDAPDRAVRAPRRAGLPGCTSVRRMPVADARLCGAASL
mgnify:CR=1 FL=1